MFPPFSVVAEVEAVVAPEDDDGGFGELFSGVPKVIGGGEGGADLADEGVDVRDAGVVAVNEFPLFGDGGETGGVEGFVAEKLSVV